jgi:hypothetical protein
MSPTYAKDGSQSRLKFFQKGVPLARTGPVVAGAVASESWEPGFARSFLNVMAALVAAIHVLLSFAATKDVDGRDKPGHDEKNLMVRSAKRVSNHEATKRAACILRDGRCAASSG